VKCCEEERIEKVFIHIGSILEWRKSEWSEEYLNGLIMVYECMQLNNRVVVKELKKSIYKHLVDIAQID
jgi:hypothetical protein